MEGQRVQSNHDRVAYWSGTPNSFGGGGPGQLMRPALEFVQEPRYLVEIHVDTGCLLSGCIQREGRVP